MSDGMDLDSQDFRDRVALLFRYGQVGRCVSSVTHDVNNVLGAIQAYSELLDLDENLSDESRRMTMQIGEGVAKCSALLSTLTTVARKPEPDTAFVDVASFVDSVLDIKRYDFKVAHVPLEFVCDEGIQPMVVDQPQLVMAIIHLLMNALDAAEENERRYTRLRLRDVSDAVEFEMWNAGPPVPEADRERIFEPFYTTKGSDHFGLGLSVARDAARLHKGDLVYNEERGFVMRLPFDNGLPL